VANRGIKNDYIEIEGFGVVGCGVESGERRERERAGKTWRKYMLPLK
jgi:hypothetical protein